MPKRLEVEIIADATKYAKGLKDAESKTSRFSKAAGIAGTAIVGGLVVGLKKSVDAAKEAQVSQTTMENQLKSLGISYKSHAGQIDKVIQSTSKLAALDDEELQGAFTKLVRSTGDVNKGLRDTKLAADVARGAHISLEAATKAVMGAEQGRSTALRRLGIDIPKVTDAQDKLKVQIAEYKKTHKNLTDAQKLEIQGWQENAKEIDKVKTAHYAIADVQAKFAGGAKAYGETAAGAQERFQVALENVEESIGTGLLPILAKVMNTVADLTGFFEKHSTVTKVLIGVVAALGGALLAVNVALKLQAAYTKVATAAQWLFNAALDANPIMLVVIGLAALGAALVVAYKKSETFREIVQGALNGVKTAMGALKTAFQAVLDWVGAHWKIIATLIAGPFAPLVALATNAFGIRSALEKAFTGIKNFAVSTFSAIGNVLAGVLKAPLNAVIGLWNRIGIHIHKKLPGPLPDINIDFQMPQIPQLATGGIVTRPTLALVGEQGPEAVVPLTGPGAAAAGGVVVNIDHADMLSPSAIQMLTAEVMRRMAYA